MDYIGGYSIIDFAGFGEINAGSTITLSDDDIVKLTDMKKPTFIQNITVTNSSKITFNISGYGTKGIASGSHVIEIGKVSLIKIGDREIRVEIA